MGVAEELAVGVAEGLGVSDADADDDGLSEVEGPAGGTEPLLQPLMPIASTAEAVTMMLRRQPGAQIMCLP